MCISVADEVTSQALEIQRDDTQQNVMQAEQIDSDNEEIHDQDLSDTPTHEENTTIAEQGNITIVEQGNTTIVEQSVCANSNKEDMSESVGQENRGKSMTEQSEDLQTYPDVTMSPHRASSRISSRVR